MKIRLILTKKIAALAMASVASALYTQQVSARAYDLTTAGTTSHNVVGAYGGTAIFSDNFPQPAGTGVFEPFLPLDANGQTPTGTKVIEQAYNTDGFTAMYMDQL